MKAFLVLVLLALFIAGVVSEQQLEKIDYDSSGGLTRIVKRHHPKKKKTPNCRCAQALADFGQDCDDPSCLVGTMQFTQNPCGQCTFTGTFLSGFDDTTADYTFELGDATTKEKKDDKIDLTRFVTFKPFKGGLKTFQATTSDFTLNCGGSSTKQDVEGVGPSVTGKTLFIRKRGVVVGRAFVRGRR